MRLRFRSQSTYLFSSQPQRGANLAAIWNVNLAPLVAATAAGAISTAINDVALPRPPPYASRGNVDCATIPPAPATALEFAASNAGSFFTGMSRYLDI